MGTAIWVLNTARVRAGSMVELIYLFMFTNIKTLIKSEGKKMVLQIAILILGDKMHFGRR